MSDATEIAREARELIAAARSLVSEWAEEGIDGFDPAAASTSVASPQPADASAPEAVARVAPAVTAEAVVQAAPAVAPPIAAATAPPNAQAAPSKLPLTLDAVRAELGECTRCGLHNTRKSIVFGDGDPQADILFIGEGPGQSEDEQGVPFVGRAGELLTQMIEKGMGLSRRDVYICNIVKCRPPRNRTPLSDEISACRPFLDGQIDAVNPKVIVSLGKPATGLLLGHDVAITRIRGTWHEYRGIPLMPTLHPAYVLRQYSAENRRAVWDDLKSVLTRLESA